ncbi:hypothetical protein [Streptomyces malaysiensis]|uniref:hypothetical protein n=1 Tax=Streptomyces malaysiensis TaxID=92644 RepID=UPI002B2EA205|nr:hypothetical protein R8789_16580 [Streptomyces malaysiensis]
MDQGTHQDPYDTSALRPVLPARSARSRTPGTTTPKDSSRVQLLEAKANLQRMLVSIPLTDDERAAVDDGQTALDTLLDRLAEVPTPAGPTPRDLNRSTTAQLLPIIEVRQGTQR